MNRCWLTVKMGYSKEQFFHLHVQHQFCYQFPDPSSINLLIFFFQGMGLGKEQAAIYLWRMKDGKGNPEVLWRVDCPSWIRYQPSIIISFTYWSSLFLGDEIDVVDSLSKRRDRRITISLLQEAFVCQRLKTHSLFINNLLENSSENGSER